MRRLVLAVLLATRLHAATGLAADSLDAHVKQADGWVAWDVPMVADAGAPCCYSDKPGHGFNRSGCDLDDRHRNFSTNDDPRPPGTDTLTVYAHVAHGRVDDVRAFEATCPVRGAGSVRRIDGVAATDSIGFLSGWMDGPAGVHDELALAAIAYHADAGATRVLASRAEPAHSRKEREDALFWLGQARGADGAAIVERVATTDGDPKLREHAVFALSQSHADDPYARIHAIAQSDPSEQVRSQALFWMAQMKDERAAGDITAALSHDASSEVREQAVFALSQLDEPKNDEALIALMRGGYPREVKKQALFWLGQSGSPRAMAFFDEALTRSR